MRLQLKRLLQNVNMPLMMVVKLVYVWPATNEISSRVMMIYTYTVCMLQGMARNVQLTAGHVCSHD